MERIFPKYDERNHEVYKRMAENPELSDGFKRNLGIEDFKVTSS